MVLELDKSARAYADRLLASLGVDPLRTPAPATEHPALTWANSGLMALTGAPDREPLMCPVPLAACADGALAALACLAPEDAFDGLRGSELLTERAAIAAYTRQGCVSPGGTCRLLEAADGWIALNLAREDDWTLVPAWLEREAVQSWDEVALAVRQATMHDRVERGRLLGLALCPVVPPSSRPVPWFSAMPAQTGIQLRATSGDEPLDSRLRGNDLQSSPLVIDLSSLWAGPLCGHLLQLCGARVIKIESTQRPDGARLGPPAFFDLLNQDKESVALDFTTEHGREQLRALIQRADIVIEASRPRALRQLGIDAEALVREKQDYTWISITGYGRGDPQQNWIAYGDDAAVAAGLTHLLYQASGERVICGDAIADPLTGLHAALAAWASWRAGGSRLISLALRDVVGYCIGFDRPDSLEGLRVRAREWSGVVKAAGLAVAAPRARMVRTAARSLGADSAAVLGARAKSPLSPL